MQQRHQKFLEKLRASEIARFFVGMWLSSLGFEITLHPQKYAPTHEQWRDYSDDGDIEAKDSDGNKYRIEVKERTLSFTCKENFPYPDIFVCTVHSWENAQIKPSAFISLNQELTHIAIVYAHSFKEWDTRDVWDKQFGRDQTCYVAPKSAVTFREIRINHERETEPTTENMSVR